MNLPSSYACITLFLCALIQAVAGFNFQVPKTNCLHHIPKPAAEFTFLTTSTRTNNNLNANRQIHKLNLHPRIRGASVTKLNSSNQDESSKSPPAVSSKQAFVYRISSILYLLSSLTIFIMPNRFEPTLLNRYPLHKVAGGTGFALAAGISLLLQTNDGTSSSSPQTMKKLNFGLAAFSFIGLFAIPGEASFHPSFQGAVGAFGIMTLARVVGGLVAGSRWLDCNVIVPFLSKKVDASSTGTAGGISGLFAECKRGIRETWFSEDSIDVSVPVDQDVNKGKRKSKKKSIFSLFYLWAIVGIVSNAISFYHSVKVPTSIPFNRSIHITAIARLSLIACSSSALKAAAWEGRLNQALFVQLKYMLCAWAAVVGVASGFIDSNLISFITQKAVYFMIFAWPIMYKGRGAGDNSDEADESVKE